MLLISLVLTSCKKKKTTTSMITTSPQAAILKIDNTEYQLSAGILDNYGTTNPNLPYETHYGYAHELFYILVGFQ